MNWIQTRNEIIAALNTVPGINAGTSPGTSTGSAWVRLGDRVRENGWFIAEYYVFIIVPQKPELADVWSDERDDQIVEALESKGIAVVASISNVEVATAGSTNQFALLITLRSS
jgi:hypothetical protein